MINYRPFVDTDVEKLVALINENVDFEKKGKKMNAQQLNEWLDEPGEEIRDHTYVAEVNGKIIGYQALCLVKDEDKINVYAYGAVHFRWLKNGVGSQLIGMSLERLKSKGENGEERSIIYNHLVHVSGEDYELANKFGYQVLTELCSYSLELRQIDRPLLEEDYRFEPVKKERVNDISDLYGLAFSWHPSESGLASESLLHEMVSADYMEDFNILCMNNNNQLIGYISGYFAEESRGVISTIAVHPAYQGRGIGKSLLKELLFRMKNNGVSHVRLSVDSNNPTGAIPLYERLGFQKGEKIIHYYIKIN